MDTPPRSAKQRLFSLSLVRRFLFLGGIQAIGATSVFFWHLLSSGIPLAEFTSDHPVYREALTMTQAAVVFGQIAVGFAVRSDRHSVFRLGLLSNRAYVAAQLVGVAMICAISYLPPLQAIFHTAPLSITDWLLVAGFGSLVLLADELRKLLLFGRKEAMT